MLGHVEKLTCSGVRACDGLSLGSFGNGSEALDCDGAKACYQMDFSEVAFASAHCLGEAACAYSNFNNHTKVDCDAVSACAYAVVHTVNQLWCHGQTACYFTDAVDVGVLHCDGDYACSSMNVHSVGYMDCESSTTYVDYLCYAITVAEVGNAYNLSCVGDFNCKDAEFGSFINVSDTDPFVLTCQGFDACQSMSIVNPPALLELRCLGSGSESYTCCRYLELPHVEELTCQVCW